MVTYKLKEENDKYLIYQYYPEGKEDLRPGTILIDLVEETISITEVAEGDWERDIPPEEINILIDSVNEMKAERGATDFEEHVTKGEHSIYYGDHAKWKIRDEYNSGNIPKEGMVMWY